MQSFKLFEPLPPKILQRCQQFMCGCYALHLFIAQDEKATTLFHVETPARREMMAHSNGF
ncbi:hypothetical protein [Bradyrhizobium sp. SBR1B]|uniref:hypothetical protein n=1 Tax=Bradyrhizobium sp. SBR1B TaxID=2663836 RepID=UPI001606268C|nr:hypothetical protein [Bradyrhizobium sp. SBR1B]MBB4380334.1 hypothetical protein [Bradyrhizobium sp. SBR1B]